MIAASGTLGQIIPPSIVIVLLGSLAGDLYASGQQQRALLAGCNDALTLLGEPAVLSVGTLFQAALLPGILLAGLYAAYAFGYAVVNPGKAPPVEGGAVSSEYVTRGEALTLVSRGAGCSSSPCSSGRGRRASSAAKPHGAGEYRRRADEPSEDQRLGRMPGRDDRAARTGAVGRFGGRREAGGEAEAPARSDR